MLEEGGDWDRRNRLKVYEGLYAMSVRWAGSLVIVSFVIIIVLLINFAIILASTRDFKLAAKLFLDAISTFTSYELMDYVR